jgi:Cu/Ag efflux pump CusA
VRLTRFLIKRYNIPLEAVLGGPETMIGTCVIGGMLAATFIAVLFIPQFFVWTIRAGDAVRRQFGFAGPQNR